MRRSAKLECGDPHDPVTVASVPISRESLSSHATDVEAAWLDRLLVAACEMPVADGQTAILEFFVRALGEIFPGCGVGACLVPMSPPASSRMPMSPTEQQVFRYVPE